jgi:UDP-N-acetylglucosamine 4,6-dehydratase
MASILVTGGTGSFGRAFVDYMLANISSNDSIRVFSRDEQKQEVMKRALDDSRVRFLLGDVRDHNRVERAMRGVDIVVHAAALKIIPIGEYNPDEVIKTNVMGSHNVIEAAVDAGVKSVICISSDKAVAPVNLYGNTKACMEKLALLANQYSRNTAISVVRYGNVIGSRGSILTLLRTQAQNGGLQITHKDMTRFWITLPQACELVLRAIASQRGGEIYVPKLKSTSVLDLCHTLYPGAAVSYTGLRPGEKMHEWLSNEYEQLIDEGWAYKITCEALGGDWSKHNRPYSSADCLISAKRMLGQPEFAEEIARANEA